MVSNPMLVYILLLFISYCFPGLLLSFRILQKNELETKKIMLLTLSIAVFMTIYHLNFGNKYHIIFPDRFPNFHYINSK